jgi:pilus assembly protein CpaE
MGEFSSLERKEAATPDVLLLDLRGRLTLPGELAGFKRRHAKTGVVIVADHLEPNLMLEAMRAGVTEWVTEPLTPADLQAAIHRVMDQQLTTSRGPSKVFAFLGAKGGVGTTTLAVNVAAALAAEPNAQVLMAELQVAGYGDAAVLLGVEPKFSTVDALENAHRLDDAFLESLVARVKPGLALLASPERPVLHPAEAAKMLDLIQRLAASYRTVVLDVPRSDLGMLDALSPSTKITIVVTQELTTIRSAAKLAALLRQHYSKDRVGVVVSRYDPRADIGLDDVERVVGLPLWASIPSDYKLASSATNHGKPFVTDPKSKLAASIRTFASDLAGVPANGQPNTKPARRFAGLF